MASTGSLPPASAAAASPVAPAPSSSAPSPALSDDGYLSSDGEEELAEVAEQHCLVFELGNPAVEVIQGRANSSALQRSVSMALALACAPLSHTFTV